MSTDTPPTLSKQRSFGLLEKYQLSKTLTNCYGSVTCTARLQHPLRLDSNDQATTLSFYLNQFYPAITTLVRKHPSLAVTVREPNESSAHFAHISCFPLDQIVSIKESTGSLDDTVGAACDETLVVVDQESTLPLWRLLVLVQADVPDRCTVIFIAHHVVIDGTSLTNFWRAFLEALNSNNTNTGMEGTTLNGNWMVATTATDGIGMGSPMESRPELPKPSYLDYGILAGGILKDLMLPIKLQRFLGLTSETMVTLWQGDHAAIEGEQHNTSMQLRKISGPSWQNLMRLAKEKYQVSVHAVLHAAFLMAWSGIYVLQPVRVTVPVNCRPHAKASSSEMGNFVGEYQHLWEHHTLLNPPPPPPPVDNNSNDDTSSSYSLLWRLAIHYHTSLQANKHRAPISGQFLGLLEYPKQYVGFWQDKRKKNRMGRDGGLEHSDLGRFDYPSDENNTWILDELWFAQSAQTYSTALGLNSVTVNGTLYATFGWQRGSLDESKVIKVMDRFVDILQNNAL